MTDTVTGPTRAEQIVYLTEWAAENGAVLSLSGTVGFGRDCVGILCGDHYVDTGLDGARYEPPGIEWWQPEDAYHKHDCLAVLGHGDGPLRQLYDWVKWIDGHGYKVVEVPRTPTSSIDLLFHGVSTPKLVKAP